jgi:carboxymethylenebutenolidase
VVDPRPGKLLPEEVCHETDRPVAVSRRLRAGRTGPRGGPGLGRRALEASPRHHEWVEVPAGEGRTVRSFVAYPEASGEDAGGDRPPREPRADRLGAAVRRPGGRGRLSGDRAGPALRLRRRAAAHRRLRELRRRPRGDLRPGRRPGDRDLLAVQKHAAALAGASGKTVVVGFCWGGAQAFRFAANSPDLVAALVFYGTGPEDEERIAAIAAPVHGFYGENDERVNATIPGSRRLMAGARQDLQVEIYEGAGHAFMRQADDPRGRRRPSRRARRPGRG